MDFLEFTKDNPVFAGIISLWGLGVVTFICRSVPSQICNFIYTQSTTHLVINSHDNIYYDFLKWTSEYNLHNFVRNLNFTNNDRWGYGLPLISVGYGLSFFFFNKRLFWMKRYKEEANQTQYQKEVITISFLGRNHKHFHDLHEVIQNEKKKDDKLRVYTWTNNVWELISKQYQRDLSTIILDPDTKDRIVTHIEDFQNEKDWYLSNGIPYRTGLLFYGPPGTGKTSLIKGICSYTDKELYIINLNTMTDGALGNALGCVPQGAIVAIEDIDAVGLENRSDLDKDSKEDIFLTLSGVLNAIDGAASSDDRIVIATTNHLERLDPALIREGRFDLKEEIGYMTKESLIQYLKRFYGDVDLSEVNIRDDIAPCQVQKLVFENRDNLDNVVRQLI
jgi:chaperone BCS1